MRVLILAQHFARSNANTFRYRRLTERLSQDGHSVDVVGDRKLNGYDMPDNTRYFSLLSDIKSGGIFASALWSLIYFFRLLVLWRFLKNIYLTYTIFICGAARYRLSKLFGEHKYDVVLVSITPWTYHIFSKYISLHSKLILDIGDPLYKNAFLDKPNGSKSYLKFETRSASYASYVPIMSEPLYSIYVDEIGIDRSKVEFVSPATNVEGYQRGIEKVYPLDHSKPLEILYAGMLYPGYRDLSSIAPAVNSVEGVLLTVITNNKVAQSHNIKKSGWVEQSELKRMYDQSDVLLFIDNFYGYQVPSKIFELISRSKPILFVWDQRNSYFYNMLKGQKGIFFAKNDRFEIERVLQDLKSRDRLEVNFDFDLNPYSEQYTTEQLIKIINKI